MIKRQPTHLPLPQSEFASQHRLGKLSIYGVLLTILASLAVPVSGSETQSDKEEAVAREVPVVLTPSRLPQRLDESPSTVTVIDRALIEACGARRLAEVFRLVPGFHVGYKYNNQPTVAYHGLSDEFARRLLLLVDGQRIFQYSRGAVDFNNLPIQLEDIERIEVVRGPNAAAYGSNAFAAVINIQTRSAAENLGAYGRVAYGEDGIADGFVRYGGRLKTLDFALSLSSKGDDGYAHVHDDRRNTSVSFLGEIPLGTDGELKLRAGYSKGDYEAQNVNPLTAGHERAFSVSDNFQSLQWRQGLGEQREWLFSLSHNAFRHGDKGFLIADAIPGALLNIDYEIQEERYEAELQHSWWFPAQWRAVAGLGYYQDSLRSPYYLNTQAWVDTRVFRVFGHTEYRPRPDWVLNAGALLEHSPIAGKWLFLPRLSAHYHIDDQHTVRVAYSTGSRQPTVYENQGRAVIRGVNVPLTLYRVYATGLDQGGLDPEINRSLELGYFWWPTQHLSLDARLFQEDITHLIKGFYRKAPGLLTVLPGNRVLDFSHDNDITLRGFEAQLDWLIGTETRVFASYALTDIDAAGTLYAANYQESGPRHSFGLLLNQNLGNGWQASLNYDYQSAMTWYLEDAIDHYHKLDARLARTFKLGNVRATAELIGTNLVGSVSDYLPSREWERGVFLRFATEY
jgi:iron complex outermembrane receptor protein